MTEKFNKYSNFNLNFSIWLTTAAGENVISDERMQLLIAIERLGSLRAAANELKISYRKAWGELRTTESLLGFQLIEKFRGGKDGGNSVLTPDGKLLVNAYSEFVIDFQKSAEKDIIKFKRSLKKS